MKNQTKILSLFIVLLISVFIIPAAAAQNKTYTVEDVPNVHVADRRQYVSDPTGVLSIGARDSINASFARLETATGIETAVVILPSVDGGDTFDFAQKLFRHWGIGKKKNNNGLLILLVTNERRVRFHTGYGIEGVLPDAVCKRIQDRYMIPAFRHGDYDSGMVAGTDAVCSVLKDSMRPEKNSEGGVSDLFNYLFLLLLPALFIVVAMAINRSRARCPRCGHRALRKMSTETLRRTDGMLVRRDTYICSHCGYIATRDHDENEGGDSGLGSFLTGMFIGSLFSGRGGGGGFSGGNIGGSFGGGDSGGGGSESGW